MTKTLTIGVAFITHNARKHLPHCLPPILKSPLKPRVLIVNSSSQDGTVELARQMGADTLLIPRPQFNHGTTREIARKHLNTDIVVMMTPDAYALDFLLVEKLIRPLIVKEASVSYARQIPHDGADFFEAIPREYNYPPQSHVRSIQDIDKYGVYTFFCSDTCAAYLNDALDDIGGFQPVLFGEDTIAVAQMLKKGHKIAYVADAIVKHSHRYSLKQEFRRHFDIGLARKECGHLLACAGKDSKRGAEFVKFLIKRLVKERPHLMPYAIMQTASKWLGYRLGHASLNAPLWLKKAFSSQDFYWVSDEGLKKELARRKR